MKISICTDAVFGKMPCQDAVALLAENGCRTIEFWGWWDKDIPAIAAAAETHGVEIAAICTRFISLVDPSLREAYLQGLRETIATAGRLGCKKIISQVGNDLGGDRKPQHESLVAGLKAAAPILAEADMTLLVEPLNLLINHPGYYLSRSDEAFEIIDEVGSPNVRILFDIYHQQITEGNVLNNILPNIDKIGHFHSAGSNGRHELMNGELNYPYIVQKIRETGYDGCFGLEYRPEAEDPMTSLKEILSAIG